MITWLYIALGGLLCAVIVIAFKAIEIRFGLPQAIINIRSGIDGLMINKSKETKHKIHSFWLEVREAISRTPHFVIHLAIVMKDKLRGRFSHYIDEVRGRRRIVNSEIPSEFINAVKEHKDTNGKGQISA